MDRTLRAKAGFTLVELVVTLLVVGLLTTVAVSHFSRMKDVNGINDDMHRISAFIHMMKQRAFTRKQSIQLTVAGKQITTTLPGQTLTLNNTLTASGSPFTISTRGNITNGNIHITDTNTGAQFSCVEVSNLRTRLGEWDGTTCTPL